MGALVTSNISPEPHERSRTPAGARLQYTLRDVGRTIRAVRVKLQAGGTVEGDIFHRSLSVEDTALFEGSSRRVENPIEAAKAPDKPRPQLAAAEGAA